MLKKDQNITTKIIRRSFIDFFKSKDHTIVTSDPIVLRDDPTLMFTNSGMNQFKNIFLGYSSSKDKKIANYQKCLRVSGKHNDLEEVGHDTYHHTMFEMLGSWSFGDYFKEEAISLAWEYLTKVCNLDQDRLYVTVFEGDKLDSLEKDNDTFSIWNKFLSKERILNGSKHDNFWEMGETGPCGPCSEIHFDNRNEQDRLEKDGSLLVNKDHPQVIEIWNLVFMQYNRKSDGSLDKLSMHHVDTGMGLERLAMIIQGHQSNYDTDIFTQLINRIKELCNKTYGKDDQIDIAMRVVSDHVRAVAFAIADGQLPSNNKAGYIIRRILRRAIRYAYTFLGVKRAFIYKLVDVLCKQMGEFYPELLNQKDLIENVIKKEETSFLNTLGEGLTRLDRIMHDSNNIIDGKQVFELYDTYGFPVDLTSLILKENNLIFDQASFDNEMKKQKDRSRQSSKIKQGDWTVLFEDDIEEFVGYDRLSCKVKIARYRSISIQNKNLFQLAFNLTPFYPESGGQVGDIGYIYNDYEKIDVIDTKKENDLIIHYVERLPENLKSSFSAYVDEDYRMSCSINHSATHLLHESLRKILGDHIEQKGSLVSSEYLRFDFSHFSKILPKEIQDIENSINDIIKRNVSAKVYNNIPLDEAKDMGARMLFGEKYADVVRIIQFEDSLELCGGTHVNNTKDIFGFKILSEGSVSSGIRRIEAITGNRYKKYKKDMEEKLKRIKSLVKNQDIVKGVEDLINENKSLLKEVDRYKKIEIVNLESTILNNKTNINGIDIVTEMVSLDSSGMKSLSFNLKNTHENLVLLLVSKTKDKLLLTLMITDDIVKKRSLDANFLIKEIAKDLGGSGGGQSFFATAGGKDPGNIQLVFEKFKKLL